MVRTITGTITEFTNTEPNVTRMVLRPSTLDYRENLRGLISRSTTYRLPWMQQLEGTEVLDSETFITLNNSTSSERREELMNTIINHENSSENRALLIENSSSQVRTYLHDLLIRSTNNSNISEEDLYRIGNIFLYTISNLDIDGLVLRDVIQNMRESMVIFNTNQVYSLLDNQVSNHNQYLENIRLASDQHIDERVQEFHREVDQQIFLNRKRVFMFGGGILATMALSSLGVPSLVGGLVGRNALSSVLDSNFISDYTNRTPSTDSVRLRDIYDEGLKFFYKTIKHFNK